MNKLVDKLNKKYNTSYSTVSIQPYIYDIEWCKCSNEVIDDIISYLYQRLNKQPGTLAIKSLFNETSFNKIKSTFSKEYASSYLILDSKYKSNAYPAPDGVFIFEYRLMKGAGGVGVVSSSSEIKNIKSITLYKPTIPSTKYTDMNHRSINICIQELNVQSYYLTNNQRAHFILKTSDVYINDNNVLDFDDEEFKNKDVQYTADDNPKFDSSANNTFVFNFPVARIERLTISIGNCDRNIVFDYDRDTAIVNSYANPMIIRTSRNHNFTRPLNATITGFTTAAPIADKNIIAYINDERSIRLIPAGSDLLIISVDATNMTPLIGMSFNIYYEDRRIILPLMIKHD